MTTPQPTPCERCGQAHARCSSHRRDGLPCTQRPMKGQSVCKMHGGKSPRALAAAERRQLEAAAGRVIARVWDTDAPPVTDHVGSLQRLAGRLERAVDVLGGRLESDSDIPVSHCDNCGKEFPGNVTPLDLDAVTATAWVRVLRELRQLLADMGRLGIAEKALQLEADKVRTFRRRTRALKASTSFSLGTS